MENKIKGTNNSIRLALIESGEKLLTIVLVLKENEKGARTALKVTKKGRKS